MSKALRRLVGPLCLCLALAGCSLLTRDDSNDGGSRAVRRLGGSDRSFSTDDPIERACALKPEHLLRIWRGHDDRHSEDITTVPFAPNYAGTFNITSHSGPWNYLQNVPLVLYGPGQIKAQGRPLKRGASIVDVYPTAGALTDVSLEQRDGKVLTEALDPTRSQPPKLIFTVMWDGVGRNVLERWPDEWPTLARMEREGTSYLDAVVGSSPSITPATHSSLGTGAYPRKHGVTAIEFRTASGEVRSSFAGRNPADLELSTYGDDIDLALGNRPLVGMIGWRAWHMGMMGHGLMTSGGDEDQLGIIGHTETITGNDDFYSTPPYLNGFSGLDERIDELDRADGESDGEWRGHPIAEQHDNAAWVRYQTDVLLAVMKREGYGADEVPDLLFTNFKMTDIAGHQYSMDAPEMGEVLRAQDGALRRILGYLDRKVGNYVVVLSADHGHTPNPERSGAWPILQGQVAEDIDAHFGVEDESLVTTTSAAGPFLDKAVMRERGVTAYEVAEFLNGYTIADNNNEPELPAGFEERADEPVFEAAWPAGRLDEVMSCALGDRAPGS